MADDTTSTPEEQPAATGEFTPEPIEAPAVSEPALASPDEPIPTAPTPSPDLSTDEPGEEAVPDDGAGYKGMYLAKEKIKGVTKDGEINIVLLKSGQTIRLPDVLLKAMATDKPANTAGMDLTPVQLRMMTVADSVEVLLRKVYLLNVGEIETFCKFLETVVGNNYNLATRLLWGGRNRYQIPLQDMQTVIEQGGEKAAVMQAALNAEAQRNHEIQRSQGAH